MVAVPADANPPPAPDAPDDAAALRTFADALLVAVDGALAGWVERSVADRYRSWAGNEAPDEVVAAARAAGERARDDVVPALRRLLTTDVDDQQGNPLAILRAAVRHPTGVLASAGVPAVVRDPQAERMFPDDAYDLTPATFGDLHPSVHEPGLVWGAAKAHVVLARRRREGRR
jgi:hypothetical protein